ncbi:tetratricopeptide repeat protein [Pseudohalioglobus lutimaris]|uniref:tetratricopeptide repeat protein n=1 Tax=Pseudohalioglobus lutimaris TaxID=1737061 RepID=UPI001055A2C5|nr:tetratricopeptide repeat protein [Pseudohalioglobus lutimaris]
MCNKLNSWPWQLVCALALWVIALAAVGRPAAYGEDFVRLGASWAEGGPGRGQYRLVAENTLAQDYHQQLLDMELQQGPYSPALAEPLDALGGYYLQQGLHSQAVAMYSRALHVVRVNDGLYSERQVPLLRGLLSAYREAEDWQTLDARYAYFFRLLGNGKPPFTELRLRAALEFLRWQREALRLGLPGERRRLLAMISLNDEILDALAMDTGAPYRWHRDLAFSQVLNLYLLSQRIDASADKFLVTAPSDYIGATPLSVDLETQRLDSLLRSAPGRGAELLQQLLPLAALQGAREKASIELALADWYFWHNNHGRANAAYAQVVNTLAAAGETALLEQWLGKPVELPDNGVFWQPPPPAGEDAAVVSARYDISAGGRLSNLELDVVSGSEDISVGGFRRRLAATLFRPRWSAGEAQRVSGVSRQYRLLN